MFHNFRLLQASYSCACIAFEALSLCLLPSVNGMQGKCLLDCFRRFLSEVGLYKYHCRAWTDPVPVMYLLRISCADQRVLFFFLIDYICCFYKSNGLVAIFFHVMFCHCICGLAQGHSRCSTALLTLTGVPIT